MSYTHFEIKDALETLTVLIDTREQDTERARKRKIDAKREEEFRRKVLRTYQQNLLKVECQIHTVNHIIQTKDPGKDAIIRELVSIVEELTGTRIKIREE